MVYLAPKPTPLHHGGSIQSHQCTTPLGQAISPIFLYSRGTSYDPGSSTASVLVGVMNANLAGLLLWASLVELLAADFLGAGRPAELTGTIIIRVARRAYFISYLVYLLFL
jgi:hypothetical protein